MEGTNQKQFALSYALLMYMVGIVLLITLIPFQFHIPQKIANIWAINLNDSITNIFLFLPLGFLFQLSRRRHKDPACVRALGFGILVSVVIEITQVFLLGRYTSVIDVMTNGVGAWVGALIFTLIKGHLDETRIAGVFALELPLMNLVYLLIPLIWLNGLSAGHEVSRLWLLVVLGLFGAIVLSSVYIHRLRHVERLSSNKVTFLAMGWFFVAALPALAHFPLQGILCGIGVGIIVRLLTAFQRKTIQAERRFELPTLRRLLPLYIFYLFLLALWPTTVAFGEWQEVVHFQELMFNERVVFIFRFVEYIAAFTLLGYIVAEMRGRKQESVTKILMWIVVLSLSCVIGIVFIKGHTLLSAVTLIEVALITGASLYGGIIYRLQLAAIQRL
ncbi:MAG TPA: VanZ family protein [Desulfatiglandales bacterium]|nr:VanZ family protein [Desulfatiglandales bacterium]